MIYYLVESLNRKTGEITQINPIDVPEEVLRDWMQPYADYLVDNLVRDLSAKREGLHT